MVGSSSSSSSSSMNVRHGAEDDDASPTAHVQVSREANAALLSRVAHTAGTPQSSVFLYPTGMASMTAAQRLLKLSSQWDDKPLPTVVWGFPYLDTLKLQRLQGGE